MSDYDQLLADASAKYKLPPWLLPAVTGRESDGDPNATSPAGAQGFLQLMPATAKGLGVTDPYDPAQNIDAGARYLKQQLDTFGTVPLALAAYNAGPGAVRAAGNAIPNFSETQAYVKNIMANAGTKPGPAVPTVPSSGAAAAGQNPGLSSVPDFSPQLFATLNAGNKLLGLPSLPAGLLGRRAAPVDTAAAGASRANKLKVKVTHNQPVSGNAAPMIALAKEYLGTPYSWGGGSKSGPTTGIGRGAQTKGFDCSAFAQFLYAKEGIDIPRVTYDQWKVGTPVDAQHLLPGDLVFFHPGKRGPEHVGIAIGQGQFIEAPRTGLTIRISDLAGRKDFLGGRRIT